jgi:EAL domain-containing protein (putative c-di-GMP-specific phosphodiesterase class I)
MIHDDLAFATVKSIVDVARFANKQVVAEFVETKEIEQALKELGVDFGQGHCYGEPRVLDIRRGQIDVAVGVG